MANDTGHTTSERSWLPVVAVTLLVFLAYDYFSLDLFRAYASETTGWTRAGALALLGYLPWALVSMLAAALLFGIRNTADALGLDKSILTGLLIGFVGTLPMLVGFALQLETSFSSETGPRLVRGSVLPGFGEELLFRAVLFGFLFRFARFGFLPAALAGALVFGAGHVWQGGNIGEAAAVFAVTALGGFWFAWLYTEWRFNLWVPIIFHVLMNGYWEVFSVADTAQGTTLANILRMATILLSILLTVIAMKRRGYSVIGGRGWLWGGPRRTT